MAAQNKKTKKKPSIGVIGLGNMGRGIANCFIRAKYQTLVWDVAAAARAPYTSAAEPGDMAGRCNIIFFVVPGSAEIDQMLKGRGGMLTAAKRGLVLYDLTTSEPTMTKKLAAKAKRKNVHYLDAGMSGGGQGAEAGTLALMIGGDERVFNRTKETLGVFTKKLAYLGPSGAGHTMKLIHNMVVHTNFMAACEAGHLAEKAGIDLRDMIDVFNAGNARSYISEFRFPNHILSETWDAKSRVYNLHKDVGMAIAFADKLGAKVNLGRDTLAYLKQAMALGMEDTDFSLIYRDFEKVAKE